ncbi:MAG: GTPase HflX [Lachnospiraceae bacterium]|nr:GTPase HflX [Lachnospiraceae bacterium]MBR4813223.1 GTPase HflX [Lachnospiraceae bacterium]
MYETGEQTEKVLLVAVAADGADGGADSAEESLDELAELVKTAGAETVGRLIQNRESAHPGTYLGKGKLEELAELLEATGASGIVTDDELTPVQMKNLENALSCNVMDRTMVILDIFAQHAMTGEGKLQVELAQLRYRSSRLVGMGRAMSRLGGGIGTRGPGEKKLEVDRRTIRNRIAQLNRELAEVKKNRDVRREQRMRSAIPVIAIVGYTNAGKSTLLNRLTDAGVLSKDALFATLDPTTRNYHLPSGQEVLFTDTVGFIRKLPHHLIDAFRSTLEEAKYSDLILHVVDASNPNADVQMAVVYDTLRRLEIGDRKVVTAMNKQDLVTDSVWKDLQAERTVRISAKTGEGIPELIDAVSEVLLEGKVYIERVYGYDEITKLQGIRKYGQLLSEEYVAEGIAVKAYVPRDRRDLF